MNDEFEKYVREILKANLKMRLNHEKNGIDCDMNDAISRLSGLFTGMMFACENMFALKMIVDKLDPLEKEFLNSSYSPEETTKIMGVITKVILNDIFVRINQNNEILINQ